MSNFSWLYDSGDYKAAILRVIGENKDVRSYKSQLATAAGCQLSYLSQVLSSEIQLTPDHAANIASFWNLEANEGEYFLNLVLLARAGTDILRRRLEKRLKELRALGLNKSPLQFERSLDTVAETVKYYSSWRPSAVHILLSLSEPQSIKSLAKRLQCGDEKIHEILQSLKNLELVKEQDGIWKLLTFHLHAASSSDFSQLHQKAWREKGLDVLDRKRDADYFYTSVSSLSCADFLRIRNEIKNAVKTTREIVEKSPEETAFCLNIDCFEI